MNIHNIILSLALIVIFNHEAASQENNIDIGGNENNNSGNIQGDAGTIGDGNYSNNIVLLLDGTSKKLNQSDQRSLRELIDSILSLSRGNPASDAEIDKSVNKAIAAISREPLLRNVTNKRQFTVETGQTVSLLQSSNRISDSIYCVYSNQFGLVFNGQKIGCISPGYTLPFQIKGENYELVYDGKANSTNRLFNFTIYQQ